MRKNTLILVLLAFCLHWSDTVVGQFIFNPVDTTWINNDGQPYPWRLRPRTGSTDTVNRKITFPSNPNNDTTYTPSDPSTRTKYWISDRLPGYLEFLPQGYDNPANANKLYPLLIFLPGCGEIQHGVFYLHPPYVTGGGVNVPALPNTLSGMGKFFGQYNYFNGVPTELRDNGSYMSSVPVKTPGQVFNPATGPREGFIVMSMMYRGDQGLCVRVLSPTVGDMDSAIDLAKKLYRVDPQRIYFTGLSNGGKQSWDFPSRYTRNKLAAAVPVCSYGQIVNGPARVQQIIDNQTHIFSITNLYDYNTNGTGVDVITRTEEAVNNINAYPGGSNWLTVNHFLYNDASKPVGPDNQIPAGLNKSEVLAAGLQNHDAWTRAYPTRYGYDFPSSRPPVYYDPATNDAYTLYEWMLLKRNTSVAIVLPVHVTSFRASRVDEGVELGWVTSTESNSEEFILERSETGDNYSRLASLPAAGTSYTEKRYQYIDTKSTNARYLYYRLLQRDRDGRLQVIGIRKVFMGVKALSARLYPNITSSTTVFEVEGSLRDKLELRLVDMSGRTLMQQVVPPRQPVTTLDVSRFQKGVYFVEARNQDTHVTLKLIKN